LQFSLCVRAVKFRVWRRDPTDYGAHAKEGRSGLAAFSWKAMKRKHGDATAELADA
jgi:hypothetical protein